MIRNIYKESKFKITSIHYGGWVKNVTENLHDMLIATKNE